MAKILLQEDDCAPDAREHFYAQLKEQYGLSVLAFEKKGRRVDSVNCVDYYLGAYKLSYCADHPFYTLYEEIQPWKVYDTQPVLEEVLVERSKQYEKFGTQNNTPLEWIAILSEEVGEASKEALEHHFKYGVSSPSAVPGDSVQDERLKRYRKECVQVAAVSVQMIEEIDRQTQGKFTPLFDTERVYEKHS